MTLMKEVVHHYIMQLHQTLMESKYGILFEITNLITIASHLDINLIQLCIFFWLKWNMICYKYLTSCVIFACCNRIILSFQTGFLTDYFIFKRKILLKRAAYYNYDVTLLFQSVWLCRMLYVIEKNPNSYY